MLHHFLRNPRTIGTVVPSSPSLAKAMACALDPFPVIIEVGAGTGAITRHLQQYTSATLLIFEFHEPLCSQLKHSIQHPNVHFFHGPVHAHAPRLLEYANQPLALLSCLPFKTLPAPICSQTEALYRQLLQANPNSFVRQFSYITLRKNAMPTRHLPWTPTKTIYANLPPATIWEARTTPAPISLLHHDRHRSAHPLQNS